MSPAEPDAALADRARRVRMVLMDVDGVLTDGSIEYATDGSETKRFSVRDGAGIRLARRAGLLTGFISGRTSPVVERRAAELGIEEVHLDVRDKVAVYAEMAERLGLSDEEVCFIGDDLVDARLMRRVGLPAAPADADPCVLPLAAVVSERPGGRGAVRQIIDLILQVQKKWDTVTKPFLAP